MIFTQVNQEELSVLLRAVEPPVINCTDCGKPMLFDLELPAALPVTGVDPLCYDCWQSPFLFL